MNLPAAPLDGMSTALQHAAGNQQVKNLILYSGILYLSSLTFPLEISQAKGSLNVNRSGSETTGTPMVLAIAFNISLKIH